MSPFILVLPSVLFKADLSLVLSKSCPRGLDYAGGGAHLVSLQQGVASYSFSSPFILVGISWKQDLVSHFPFSDLSRYHRSSRDLFLSVMSELPIDDSVQWAL